MNFDPSTLQKGDVLLYGGNGLIDWLISAKTWSKADHIEVSEGPNTSLSSRNGVGVNRYPFRFKGLRYVLRPNLPLDWQNGLNWFEACAKGRPYGWSDLLAFTPLIYSVLVEKLRIVKDNGGLICSEFGDLFFLNCAAPLFNHQYPAGTISPRDFLVTPCLDLVWTPTD